MLHASLLTSFFFLLKSNKKHGRLFVTNRKTTEECAGTRPGLVAVGCARPPTPPHTHHTGPARNKREESTRIQVLRSEWKSRASCAHVCWWMMPKEERREAAGSVSLCSSESVVNMGTNQAKAEALLPVWLVEVEALALPSRVGPTLVSTGFVLIIQ